MVHDSQFKTHHDSQLSGPIIAEHAPTNRRMLWNLNAMLSSEVGR